MNVNYWIILLIMMSMVSCNSRGTGEGGGSDMEQERGPETEMEVLEDQAPSCYLFATDRDTVYLKLNPSINGKVTGDLNYYFFERDGNTGHFIGEFQGDTLFAEYTFQSEGLISVREVAFLIRKNQVVEGYGKVEEKDGRMVFWHRDSLDFTNGLVLPQIPCKD